VEDNGRIRAIGCTNRGDEAIETIKGVGTPFDLYTYEKISSMDIPWRDIISVDL